MKKQIQSIVDSVRVSAAPLLEKIDALNEKKNKGIKLEPPENSVPIRVIATTMAFLVITLACYYADLSLLLTLFYLTIAMVGSYLAYVCRARKNVLMIWTTALGIIFVMGSFAQEMLFQLYIGKLTPLVPFVQVVTGLQALHMLDLRTRADINTSIGVGLGLICCSAVIGKDIAFGIGVLIYISLAALLLYLQCISYSADGVKRAASGRELFGDGPAPKNSVRKATGSTFFMISTLPVASVFLFLNLPRIETLIDSISATIASVQTPIQLSVTFPSGFSGASGGSGPDGKGTNTTASFGSKPPPGFTGTVQVKDDPNSKKEVKLPSGYQKIGVPNPDKQADEGKNSQTSTLPEQVKPSQPVEHKYGDFEHEEEMTLNFEGKEGASQNNELLMTIDCNREVFLRRLCFDHFDGQNWSLTSGLKQQSIGANQDIFVAVTNCPAFKNDYLPGIQVHQTIYANAPLGHILPVPWLPSGVKVNTEKISVDQNGIIRLKEPIVEKSTFETLSTVPVYNIDSMRNAKLSSDEEQKCREALSVYLQLPPTATDQVPLLARGLTRSQSTWFAKAETVAAYLRSNFSYSLKVTPPDKSEDLVSYFLFKSKAGDCTHFASAFTVLMRSAGIPARCVGGFNAGQRSVLTGKIEVHASDAHAWAEVYIPHYGWVPFDAVPEGYLPGPRPDKSITATIALSDPVKAVKDFVQSVVQSRSAAELKAKGAGDGTNDSKGAASQQGGGQGGTSSADKGKTTGQVGGVAENGSGDGKDAKGSDGKRSKPTAAEEEIARASQFGQNSASANNSFKLSLQGLTGRARTFGMGVFGREFSFKETKFDLDWLKRNWQPIAAVIVLAPLLVLLAFVLWTKLPLLGGRKKASAQELKPSTIEFLKVIDDLSKIKFKRAVGQTPQEIVEQVATLVANNPDEALKANLPGLLEEFMDSYCSTRFAPEESPAIGSELREMGNKIHELVTSRPDSK